MRVSSAFVVERRGEIETAALVDCRVQSGVYCWSDVVDCNDHTAAAAGGTIRNRYCYCVDTVVGIDMSEGECFIGIQGQWPGAGSISVIHRRRPRIDVRVCEGTNPRKWGSLIDRDIRSQIDYSDV